MKRHLFAVLMAALFMAAIQAGRAQTIVPVQDQAGHTVWVNNTENPTPQSASPISSGEVVQHKNLLVYWSRAEHRWKPAPLASSSAMRQARQAAQEVTQFVVASPKASRALMLSEPVSPDTADLVRGRQITPEALDSAIEASASRHGVDPNLVRAVIKVESNFNPHAVSRKGAIGLMQLMPQTARSMNVRDAFDPHQNVDAGVRHLKSLLANYNGNIELSLAAYNAGSNAVKRSRGIPPYRETRDYVKRITELYFGGSALSPAGARIRMSRDAEGHLVFSNN